MNNTIQLLALVKRADKEIAERDAIIAALRLFAAAVLRYAGNMGDDYLADKAREALEATKVQS